jgi:hypothetical protein
MYIKTQNNTLLNMDRVVCMDILKSINTYHAEIRAKADEFEFEIYSGDINDVEDAYYTIQEGLIKGASLIDFSKD